MTFHQGWFSSFALLGMLVLSSCASLRGPTSTSPRERALEQALEQAEALAEARGNAAGQAAERAAGQVRAAERGEAEARARADAAGPAIMRAMTAALALQGLQILADRLRDVERLPERAKEPDGVDILIQSLYDSSLYIRSSAAEVLHFYLRRIEDDRIIESLTLAVNDNEESVRAAAVEALGKIRGAWVIEPLLFALKDDESYIRFKAVESLEITENKHIIKHLSVALKNNDRTVREAAVEALGRTGDSRVIEPLLSALKDDPDLYPTILKIIDKIEGKSSN